MQQQDFQEKIHSKKPEILSYLQQLGVGIDKIQNEEMLLQTFVHKSFSADHKDVWHHNERLEFVGDGILGAVINKLLFIHNPMMSESELTLYKIALVREEILAEVARDIQLDKVLFVSKGEERSKGREKNSILSDGLEALIGFLYIELGTDEAEKFIVTYVYSKFDQLQKTSVKSYKTLVQELLQKEQKMVPEYIDTPAEVDEKGNAIMYKSELYFASEKQAEGWGTNKKKAQEAAAKQYHLKRESTKANDISSKKH